MRDKTGVDHMNAIHIRTFPEHAQTDGDVTFTPFIHTKMLTVGYECRHADGRVEYLYFNPSQDAENGDGGPDGGTGNNVFVYQGRECDPASDMPRNFYYVFLSEDWPEANKPGVAV